MSGLPIAKPSELDIDSDQLEGAYRQLRQWVTMGKIPGVAIVIGRNGKVLQPQFFGKHQPEGKSPPLTEDALFLSASITKPVVVGAMMTLVEKGELALSDRVKKYLPRFTGDGRDDVQIRHLMCHTSGLPDMVSSNNALRAGHKPLSAFIEAIYHEPLLFPPGTKVSYQSMGLALLGEIFHQLAGTTLAEYLQSHVFEPLQMKDTSLGWNSGKKERIARIRVSEEMRGKDWNWNSEYWLALGAPWGGMITSPMDLARYCQMILNGGELEGKRLLSRASIEAMTRNQLDCQLKIPEEDRRCKPWGLGWRLNWPGHSSNFGDLLGPRAFGHWGATGTVCWIDPDQTAYGIILSTQPQEPEGFFLARISNMVCAAFR